jgi:hypothetical protein
VKSFEDLPSIVLGPLEGRSDEEWHAAPQGKWSPGQIVHHLAVGIDLSGRAFASRVDKPPMRRRPRSPVQRLAHALILSIGYIPPGGRAPETTLPAQRPDRAATERQLREGVARFVELAHTLLPRRAHDLFVKHPVMGDLTIEEWMRFHVRHATHHVRQIRRRLGLS